jgi:hypothetical protein
MEVILKDGLVFEIEDRLLKVSDCLKSFLLRRQHGGLA